MPQKELERLQAVHRFLTLDINKDAELQEIVELTAELLDCPVAMITLMDGKIQYFLYKVGTEIKQNEKENTFCQYLKSDAELLIIPDTVKDKRFTQNPFVAGFPYLRFYAGAALMTHDGHKLGSLCTMDIKPHEVSAAQQHSLKVLAKRVIQIMEFEFSINLLKKQFIQARESEIKLRSFFESSAACHLLISREMEILAFNKNMADFLWRIYDVKLVPGLPVSKILEGEALNNFTKDFEAALTGQTVKFEREITYRNNERIWWYVTFELGYNPEGDIIGISYNATDITERKMNESLILEQNASLKEIAFIQSHELRKPVASILGLMEVIRVDHADTISKEIKMFEVLTRELDDKIKQIVGMVK